MSYGQDECLMRILRAIKDEETKLDLSYLGLKKIPEEILELKNLKKLYLRGNLLEIFPEITTRLLKLRVLALDKNNISEIPDSIGYLTDLEELYLEHNQIKKLPSQIGRLVNLEKFEIEGNPIESPPIEIVKRGIFSIINYLSEIGEDKEFLFEAKLLIVGEGGAGKTTLCKKITNTNYSLNNEELSTQGIDVYSFYFNTQQSEKKFRLNIWDFGGQEIYHSTHQFFLTKRSLYAIVADTRKEDTDFNYWLNLIELLSDNSPILIVQNEKQDRKRELNFKAMQGRFENVKELLRTNLKTNRGFADLVNEIQHQASKLPLIGTVLPKTWITIREVLERDERNHISYDQFIEICNQHGIIGNQRIQYLSQYFHDLGVFLHFQEEKILKKIVILKSNWATEAVYNLLDNKDVIDTYGKFNYAELKNIWDDLKYKDMHDELLELMMKFELCYQIENSKLYIAPQLLPIDQPDYSWSPERNLLLKYRYDFLPKGIISRFIVRVHKYINNQLKVWREGVILEKDGADAEIRQLYDSKEISVKVKGPGRVDFLIIIMEEFEKIHLLFPKIRVNKLIPCICIECKESADPYFFIFQNLRKRKDKGIDYIDCENSLLKVNVKDLLEGLDTSNIDREWLLNNYQEGNLAIVLQKLYIIYDNDPATLFYISQYSRLIREINLGIISHQDQELEMNRLSHNVLKLIQNIKIDGIRNI